MEALSSLAVRFYKKWDLFLGVRDVFGDVFESLDLVVVGDLNFNFTF